MSSGERSVEVIRTGVTPPSASHPLFDISRRWWCFAEDQAIGTYSYDWSIFMVQLSGDMSKVFTRPDFLREPKVCEARWEWTWNMTEAKIPLDKDSKYPVQQSRNDRKGQRVTSNQCGTVQHIVQCFALLISVNLVTPEVKSAMSVYLGATSYMHRSPAGIILGR